MTRPHAVVLSLLLATVIQLHAGGEAKGLQATATRTAAAHDIDTAGMDRSIRPGDDFFAFANGAWFKRAEIPPDRGSAGIWSELSEQAAQHTRELLEGLAPSGAASGTDER